MRRVGVIAALAFVAMGVSRLAVMAMSPQGKTPTVAIDVHQEVTPHEGRFFTPAEQVAADPLELLHGEGEHVTPDLAAVRSILTARQPRLIVVTAAEAPLEPSSLAEIVRICSANAMPCVHLDLVTQGPSHVHGILAHADVYVGRDTAGAHRPAGLFLYDASGNLVWQCPVAHAAVTHDLSIIVQTMNNTSLWGKEHQPQLAHGEPATRPPVAPVADTYPTSKPPVAPVADIHPAAKPYQSPALKPREQSAPPKSTAGAIRLSAIDGQIVDAKNASAAWTPLRSSWFVTNFLKASKRPTLLVFWATWCAPCMKEFPLLDELRQQYQSGVLFVGLADELNSPVARQRVAEAIKGYNFQLHYLLKDSSVSRAIFKRTDVPLPAFALFDSDGNLAATQVGSIGDPHNGATLRASLDRLAAKPSRPATN